MGVVCCDIGGGTTDVAVYMKATCGTPWSFRWAATTSPDAHGLRLPADVAEKLKIDHRRAAAT
jgi:cell division ATPase FtsA